MVRELRARGETVAIVAVDPSSRQTGGALLGDRTVRVSEKILMSPTLPFTFAVLLLFGPAEAIGVCVAVAIGAGVPRVMPFHQIAFNASALALCTTAAWACYQPLRPMAAPLHDHTLAVLVASLGFFVANAAQIGAMTALTGRGTFFDATRVHLATMAMPTIASAAIALMSLKVDPGG